MPHSALGGSEIGVRLLSRPPADNFLSRPTGSARTSSLGAERLELSPPWSAAPCRRRSRCRRLDQGRQDRWQRPPTNAHARSSLRSWRDHHGGDDHGRAANLALTVSGSEEAASVLLERITIVARDEIAKSWPLVERLASALVNRRTLSAAEVVAVVAQLKGAS